MIHILITYSVNEQWADYNKELIQSFMQQLRDYSIQGVSHVVYKVGATSFIHICRYTSLPLCEIATNIPSFRHFSSTLEGIVDNEPLTTAIDEIGHYPE